MPHVHINPVTDPVTDDVEWCRVCNPAPQYKETIDEGAGGGGLPAQWTAGDNGDVIAAVDDAAKTPFTIQALAGQTAPLSEIKDENGGVLETLSQETGALGATKAWGLPDARMEVLLDHQAGVFNEVTFRLSAGQGDGPNALFLDVYEDLVDQANSYTQLKLKRFAQQTAAMLKLTDELGGDLFAVGPTGVVEIAPSDAEVDDLVNIVVPETYVDDSNFGRMLRMAYAAMPADEYIYSFGLDRMLFRAAAGEGDGSLQVSAEDTDSKANIGTAGLELFDEAGQKFVAAPSGGSGQLGLFDKAATGGAAQQTLTRPSGDAGDLWDVLEAYGLVKAP